MATFKTDFKTAQDALANARTMAPSARPIQQDLKFAVFTFTVAAAMAANDVFELGYLNVDGAVIVPELSKIKVATTAGAAPGTCSNVFKLQSRTAGAAAVDESAVCTAVTETANEQSFGKLAYTATRNQPLVAGLPNSAGTNSGSYLQLALTTNTTDVVVGDVITVEVAYRVPKNV